MRRQRGSARGIDLDSGRIGGEFGLLKYRRRGGGKERGYAGGYRFLMSAAIAMPPFCRLKIICTAGRSTILASAPL